MFTSQYEICCNINSVAEYLQNMWGEMWGMKPKYFAIVKHILSFYVYSKPALHKQAVIQFNLAFCLSSHY